MAAKAIEWKPEGFDDYHRLFPATPSLSIEPGRIRTPEFIERWYQNSDRLDAELRAFAHGTTIVFVRGFLGSYMPGNLVRPMRKLRELGFDAIIARTSDGGPVHGNARRLIRQLENRPNRSEILFCGHSRGALESLLAIGASESIRRVTAGVLMSQTAHGPSSVIDSMLFGKGREVNFSTATRIKEIFQATGLFAIGAYRGGKELGSDTWPSRVSEVENTQWPFPRIQCASWSSQPTTWLDSWHARLGQIRPGHAHDGQFYLNDLIWPEIPHILLPQIDHAQPAVGGYGFDEVRYWLAMISLILGSR